MLGLATSIIKVEKNPTMALFNTLRFIFLLAMLNTAFGQGKLYRIFDLGIKVNVTIYNLQ